MNTSDLSKYKIVSENVVDKSEIASDVEGGFYYREIKEIVLEDGRIFEDDVFNAPWQVGGNSGEVRELTLVGFVKTVKPHGNGGRVILPADLIGSDVTIYF